MPGLVISVGPAKKGKLSDAIVEEMRKKKGMASKAPAEDKAEAEEAEAEAPEGADEETAFQEMWEAADSGDFASALKSFKALMAACGY